MRKCIVFTSFLLAFGLLAYADNDAKEKCDSKDVSVFFSSATQQATTPDIRKGMSYREIKRIYNPKEYIRDVSDPYNPGVAGVCSFFIPGLGQILDAQVGRGLLMMVGAGVCAGATVGIANYLQSNQARYDKEIGVYSAIALVSAIGFLSIDVWSIVDAVRVAKVQNMYNQDLRKLYTNNDINLSLSPSLAYVPMANGIAPTAGFALRVVF